MKLHKSILLIGALVFFAVHAFALTENKVRPPEMPSGMPMMPRLQNPNSSAEHKPSELQLLAAKPYRPSWAPVNIFRGETEATGAILPILSSADAMDRARAAFVLGQIGDPSAVKPLQKLLTDKDANVRMQAAVALGEIGDTSGISQMAKGFDQAPAWLRCYAVHSLWNINTAFARNFMLERQKNQPPMVAQVITEAVKTKHTKYPQVKPRPPGKKVMKADPEDIWFSANDALITESDFWWHAGNYDQIIRCLEAAVFLDVVDVESYSLIAWLQWSMQRDELGIDAVRRGVAFNPDLWDAHYELGSYFTRSDRWKEAEEPFKKAVELGATPMVQRMYAHCLEKIGKIQESLAVWEKLLAEYPQDEVIKNNYNRVKRLVDGQNE